MTQRYIADFSYGQARLAQVEAEKETTKTITTNGRWLNLVGQIYYLPGRILKSNYFVYDTEEEAIAWLLSQAEAHQRDLEKSLVKAKEQVKELRGYLADDNP